MPKTSNKSPKEASDFQPTRMTIAVAAAAAVILVVVAVVAMAWL